MATTPHSATTTDIPYFRIPFMTRFFFQYISFELLLSNTNNIQNWPAAGKQAEPTYPIVTYRKVYINQRQA